MFTPFDKIPPEYRESAEQVSNYLVSARGGALFLSGADLRLLMEWLDAEIPIPAILASIDQVATRRREKRVRTRLSLSGCKSTLNKILYKKSPNLKESKTVTTYSEALHLWSVKIRDSLTEESLLVFEQRLFAQRLDQLAKKNTSREHISVNVIEWMNEFHDLAWSQYGCQQYDWIEVAELELQNLKKLLTAVRWTEAVEEVARDRLMQLFPYMQAQYMWSTLNGVQS